MNEPIKRLLFTGQPLTDESLFSYLMRLAEMNVISDLRWILKLICPKPINEYHFKISFDEKIDLQRLFNLTGVTSEELVRLFHARQEKLPDSCELSCCGLQRIDWRRFRRREMPKICSLCLNEQRYCQKVWEISVVTACPHHGCLLIDECQGCGKRISWQRPALNLCRCRYDFRQSGVTLLEEKELRLAAFFHRELGLPCCSGKSIFSEPLAHLNSSDLLKLLFFIGSHLTGEVDFFGKHLTGRRDNAEVHLYLSRSVEIFDDWTTGYHRFVRDVKKRSLNGYLIPWQHKYIRHALLPVKNNKYELFHQTQRTVLFEEQFSFIHEELVSFLENRYKDQLKIFSESC